jgi:phage-related protein
VQFLGDTTRLLGKDFGKVFDAIGGIGTRVFNQFKDAIDGVKGKTDAVNNFLSGIPGLSLLSGSKLDELKGKVQGVANTLTQQKSAGFLDTLNDKMKSLSSGALKGITDDIGRFGQHVNDFANYLSHVDTKPFVDGIIQVGGAFKNIASLQWDQFKTVLKDIGEDAKQVGGWFLSSVVPAMKQAAPGFASLGMTMLTTVIPAFIQVRGVVIDVIQHAFEKFAPIIEQIVPPLIRFAGILAKDVSDGLQFIMPYVIQATTAIGRFADEIIDRVAPIVSGWIKALTPLVQMFMDNWNKNWPLTLALLQSVWGMIVGVVQVAWAIVSGIIKIGLDILGGNWKQAWTDFSDMLGGIWDGIKTYLKGAWDGIRALVGAAFGKLGTDAMDAGGNIIKQLAAGITGALNFVSDAIKSVTQFISDHLPHSPAKIGPLRDLMLQGSMIPDQIAQGMLGNQSKLNSAIAQLAKPISASLNLRSSSYPSGTSNNSAAILAAVASSTSSSGNNNQNAEFHIYLDSKEITAKVGNNMASAIRAKGVRNR